MKRRYSKKKYSKKEIKAYRRQFYMCLKGMRDGSTGKLCLTEEQAYSFAYDLHVIALRDCMQYNTPQELADLWTM